MGGGSRPANSEICFVIGFPRNQEQRNQSRAAIQGNSSRIRWRKGTSTADPSRFDVRPRRGTSETVVRREHNVCLLSPGQDEIKEPKATARSPPKADHALSVFSRSLHDLVLPPFLPVEDRGLLDARDMWSVVQNSEQAFTEEPIRRLSTLPTRADRSPVQRFWDGVFLKGPEDSNSCGRDAWMYNALNSTVSFQTNMFCHYIREYYRNSGESQQSLRMAQKFYAMAVTALRQSLQDPLRATDNAAIMAAALLTVHAPLVDEELQERSPNSPGPSQGPLKSLQFIDLYGGLVKPAKVHRVGWFKMVEQRGGIEAAGLTAGANPLTM